MKYAVEIGSFAMIYIPSFIKIGRAIKSLGRGNSQTHKRNGKLIFIFLNQLGRLKVNKDSTYTFGNLIRARIISKGNIRSERRSVINSRSFF
jgi:hypothetical protein